MDSETGVRSLMNPVCASRCGRIASACVLSTILLLAPWARADEGGVSFWIPGFFGSLAAAPLQPGWSVATIYYHTSVDAGGDVAFARQVTRGNLKVNFTGGLRAVLDADADLGFVSPSYTFASRVFGGQLTVATLVGYGRAEGAVDATFIGSGPLGLTVSGSASDTVTGFADLPMFANLRWNSGVHNYMTYIAGNIPVGNYEARRLANLGIGHSALDGGFGYTYFNPKTGNEFSAVLGFTYNFENFHTDYQNGVDMHLDWGASKFLTKQLQVGLVGYAYQQLTCDGGSGNRVGCFESRVFGVGPQVGYIVPLDKDYQGYVNLKGYWEFEADHRAEGWNVWLTFSISPAAPKAAHMQ
jgi:hypothetical protein